MTTDFSPESARAFYHALAFAVAEQARLTVLHTGSEGRESVPWERFPSVRETLTAWGMLDQDASREAVSEALNLSVVKKAVRNVGPRRGITEYLARHPTDLLVMATEGRTGLARMIRPSIAETVAFVTRSPTLMLPRQGHDLVDPDGGRVRLGRVLCALDADLHGDPLAAHAYLSEWLPVLGGRDFEARLLHLGAAEEADQPVLPRVSGQHWQYQKAAGDSTGAIVQAARAMDAELVVMSMRSPFGPMTRLRGTRIDRVLRELRLPLLALPSQPEE